MTIDFNDNDRKPITATITVPLDLTNAEASLTIDGVSYAITWTSTATHTGDDWTRKGVTGHFAGPAVPAADLDGAPVLALGEHALEVNVVAGQTRLSRRMPRLVVRR